MLKNFLQRIALKTEPTISLKALQSNAFRLIVVICLIENGCAISVVPIEILIGNCDKI